MAENNLPPELIDALREFSEAVRHSTGMFGTNSTANKALSEEAINAAGAAKALRESQIKSKEISDKIDARYNRAKEQSIATLDKFGTALFSTTKGLEKYGGALETAGDAALTIGKNFGLLGLAVGAAVKGATMLGAAALKQTDAVLKASDDLSKIGGAGGLTSKQLLEMGHRAALTEKNLDLMIKPMKDLGGNLLQLGTGIDDGISGFGKLIAVTDKQRMYFQRLGVSQEELIAHQADFVKLQAISGRNLTAEGKSRAELQRASLEYTENLLVLAKISGEDVESVKRKQQQAKDELAYQINNLQLQNKIDALRAKGDDASIAAAERLEKERDGLAKSIDQIAGTMDKDVAAGVRNFLVKGALTGKEETELARMGLLEDLQKLRQTVKEGGDVATATAEFQNAYVKKYRGMVNQVGDAVKYGGEATGRLFNMTTDTAKMVAKYQNTDFVKEQREGKKTVKEGGEGGKDPAQDARAKTLELERSVQVELSKLIMATNPLISGFTATTKAAIVLQGAAVVAAAALTAMAAKAGLNKIAGIADAAGSATKGLSKVAKAGGTAGAVLGSAFIGFEIGDAIVNPILDKVAESLTGTKGESFGTAMYGFVDKMSGIFGASDKDKQARADLDAKIALGVKRMAEGHAISKDMYDTLKKAGKDVSNAKIATPGAPKTDKPKTAQPKQPEAKTPKKPEEAASPAAVEAIKKKAAEEVEAEKKALAEKALAEKKAIEDKATIDLKAKDELYNKAKKELETKIKDLEKTVQTKNLETDKLRKETEEQIAKLTKGIPVTGDTKGIAGTGVLDRIFGKSKDEKSKIPPELQIFYKMIELNSKSLLALNNNLSEFNRIISETLETITVSTDEEDETKKVDVSRAAMLAGIYNELHALKAQTPTVPSAGARIPGQAPAGPARTATAAPAAVVATKPTPGAVATSTGQPSVAAAAPAPSPAVTPGAAAGPVSPAGPTTAPTPGPSVITDPDAGQDGAQVDRKKPTTTKPKNINVQQTADLSGLDQSLLTSFYAAAEEFGKGISINSAYRGDKKQAELWVRGRILREPGIFTPAAPKNDTTIDYKGQTYNVKGSGRGSSHGNGQALDISADYASFDPILTKYGLHRPYRANDPPHVEKIKASDGGIANGPETGYPATLHGREMIVPLEPNSILEQIAKTTANATESLEPTVSDTTKVSSVDDNLIREILNANAEIYSLIADKLDTVINVLGEGNDTNRKILKHSRI